MTYRPTKATRDFEAPPGIGPWRELSDEEHARLEATYDGDLSRWYERVDDAPPADATKRTKKAASAAGGDER